MNMEISQVIRNYDAYGGNPAFVFGARSAYTGQPGESGPGVYFLGQRLYITFLRRFVSADGLSPFDAGGLNRYAYCGGDPINRIDPDGAAFWSWLSAAARRVDDEIRSIQAAMASTVIARSAGAIAAAPTSRRAVGVGDLPAVAAPGAVRSPDGTIARSTGTFGLMAGRHRRRTRRLGNGAIVTHYTFSMNAVSRRMRTERRFSDRLDPVSGQPIPHLEPVWHAVPNHAGGYVYLADSMVTAYDVIGLVTVLVGPRGVPGKGISVLYGAHGYVGGEANWANLPLGRFRRGADPALVNSYSYAWPRIQFAAGGRPVTGTDMAGLTPLQLYEQMNKDELVIYATCFGATDGEVMGMFNIRHSDAYVLV